MAQMTRLLSEELPALSLYYDVGVVPHVSALGGPGPVGPDTSALVAWNVQEWTLL